MKLLGCFSLFCLSVWACAHAAQVNVRYENETYYLSAAFDVMASPERVMQILTDFENIADLNPAIIESEQYESSLDNNLRVKTVVKDCILFFCKTITRVEDISREGNSKLEAFIVPMLSDLRSGYASWELESHADNTNVTYEASMQPKFWIPPIIRSYVLKKKFKKRVNQTVQRLQAVAAKEE